MNTELHRMALACAVIAANTSTSAQHNHLEIGFAAKSGHAVHESVQGQISQFRNRA